MSKAVTAQDIVFTAYGSGADLTKLNQKLCPETETSRHQVSNQQQSKQLHSLPPTETSLFSTVCFVLIRQLIVVSTQSSCGATAIQLCAFF